MDCSYGKGMRVNSGFDGYQVLTFGFYEFCNHLGNVLAVVSDRRTPHQSGIHIDYYEADVTNATLYYPFGMEMKTYQADSNGYRYGFNGKETDSETGTQDYGLRIYNPALGKFLSVDPLTIEYPWNSPYGFAENDVIRCIDLEGAEKLQVNNKCEPAPDGTAGSAKITISMDYIIINSGLGKVNHNIDLEILQAKIGTGEHILYYSKLPLPEEEPILLSKKHRRWVTKAENGNEKYAKKLFENKISYYRTEIEYKVSVTVRPSITLIDALSWLLEDKVGRGIVMSTLTDDQLLEIQCIFAQYEKNHPDVGKEEIRAIYLSIVEINGAAVDDEKAGGAGNPIGHNVVVLKNDIPKTIELTATEALFHEMGHNMANEHLHKTGKYEYRQAGWSSNRKETLFIAPHNSEMIIEDKTNRQTIHETQSSEDN